MEVVSHEPDEIGVRGGRLRVQTETQSVCVEIMGLVMALDDSLGERDRKPKLGRPLAGDVRARVSFMGVAPRARL